MIEFLIGFALGCAVMKITCRKRKNIRVSNVLMNISTARDTPEFNGTLDLIGRKEERR